ncbi:FemAB family PEP-CTERM system-associated protein [Desulfatiferula olefinivorans]
MNKNIVIKELSNKELVYWDLYVKRNKSALHYHLSGWKSVIEDVYNHKAYYIAAIEKDAYQNENLLNDNNIVGILPMIFINHSLFGKKLTSIPYFDIAGVIAENSFIENSLIEYAIKILFNIHAYDLELRQNRQIEYFKNIKYNNYYCETKTAKVSMFLDLPQTSEELLGSFKSKLRNQIKKPLKEGLKTRIGWGELLDDFYNVFEMNMRDLGSPVHSHKFFKTIIEKFRKHSKIFVVYKGRQPVASSIVLGHNKTLHNPWASSLRKFSKLSPNMLLYWEMLEYACENHYERFDFGRSTKGEGTYKFKKQWGAESVQLYWNCISSKEMPFGSQTSERSYFQNLAINYWKKLPVSISSYLGPKLRKYIDL